MNFARAVLISVWLGFFTFDVLSGDYLSAVGDMAWALSLVFIDSNNLLAVLLQVVGCLFLGVACYLLGSVFYVAYLVLAVAIVIVSLVNY